jgi:hypothetical protein
MSGFYGIFFFKTQEIGSDNFLKLVEGKPRNSYSATFKCVCPTFNVLTYFWHKNWLPNANIPV